MQKTLPSVVNEWTLHFNHQGICTYAVNNTTGEMFSSPGGTEEIRWKKQCFLPPGAEPLGTLSENICAIGEQQK